MLKVIIDTDIGDDIDDAFALLCALANPEFDILGITTVFKNTPQRAKIVKDILKSVGREDIPVFAGIEVPLTGNVIKWDYENYGSDGKVRVHHYREDMSDYTYNEGSAVDFILETAKKYPNEVTLIALAPFTNIGEACKKDPKAFALLKEAYIMAGQPFTEYAEWNVRVDPYSAKTFFESGIDITCYPLNVTTKCKLYEKEIERVYSIENPAVKNVANMMRVWIESNNPSGELKRYPTMHDPLCMIGVTKPEVCSYEQMEVKVITEEGQDFGKTKKLSGGALMKIATEVNVDAFFERYFTALEKIMIK